MLRNNALLLEKSYRSTYLYSHSKTRYKRNLDQNTVCLKMLYFLEKNAKKSPQRWRIRPRWLSTACYSRHLFQSRQLLSFVPVPTPVTCFNPIQVCDNRS